MEGLTKGRIVRYVVPEAQRNSRDPDPVRAAIVTSVHDDEGLVNLSVFNDGSYDGPHGPYATSVSYDPDAAGGTWHWPGEAPEPLLQVPDEPEAASEADDGAEAEHADTVSDAGDDG